MVLPTAQDSGWVWIDCLPFETHRDAPFGVDANGLPWAPYGRDAEGRFRNYSWAPPWGSPAGPTGVISWASRMSREVPGPPNPAPAPRSGLRNGHPPS